MYVVEDEFPIPAAAIRFNPRGQKYPFMEMKVGDSFLKECARVDYAKTRKNIQVAIYHARKAHGLRSEFVTLEWEDDKRYGLRCWRVK